MEEAEKGNRSVRNGRWLPGLEEAPKRVKIFKTGGRIDRTWWEGGGWGRRNHEGLPGF